MTASGALLSTDDLVAGYGRLAVVRQLSLTVDAGEVVAILGPNGAGKTTTLMTLAGLLPPLGGETVVLGERLRGRRHAAGQLVRAGLGYVPDDRALFPELTVREHLAVSVRRRRPDTRDVIAWFPALDELLDRRAGVLSGGEQQMLSLACALIRRPLVLLIDELSMGLAPLVVERLLSGLRQVVTQHGTGVLLVEQHAPLALQWADRVLVLNHGDLVQHGDVSEFRDAPERLHASYLA